MKKIIIEALDLGLQYHSTLNSQIWQDFSLKENVRNQLLKIAKYWQEFANIPEDAIKDIVFTGSLANYNYTPMSDFDLHLVVDMDKMPIRDEELRTKNIFHMKALWAKTHPDIKIFGYPVELFAEDYKTRHPLTQGVYSLIENKWIQIPPKEDINYENDANLKSKINHYQRIIDDLIDNDRGLEHIKAFKEKLRNMRSDSIQKFGELRGVNNLVFKELRNRGYLDKLSKHETQKFDHEMSLHEEVRRDTLDDHIRFADAGIRLPDDGREIRIDTDGNRAYYNKPGGGFALHFINHLLGTKMIHNYDKPGDTIDNVWPN